MYRGTKQFPFKVTSQGQMSPKLKSNYLCGTPYNTRSCQVRSISSDWYFSYCVDTRDAQTDADENNTLLHRFPGAQSNHVLRGSVSTVLTATG